MGYDLSTPGWANSIVRAYFQINGEELPMAIVDGSIDNTRDEELLYVNGKVDANQRAAGNSKRELSLTFGGKQWAKFVAREGGDEAVEVKEYTLTMILSPDGDTDNYVTTFYGLNFRDVSRNINNQAEKATVKGSFFQYETKIVAR
jgi:hypothetical protein